MGRLDGKVAIITGAASGMGLAAVKLFAQEGAKVVGTDIQKEKLEARLTAIAAEGYDVSAYAMDITDEEAWKNVVAFTVEKYGKITILINNAGAATQTQILDITAEELTKSYAINVLGPIFGIKYCLPELQKSGGGSIVTTSSTSALVPDEGVGLAYCVAKGGLLSMTKHLAMEYGKDHIRVNLIYPGPIYTELVENLGISPEQFQQMFKDMAPLPPHAGEPLDIANAYLYFASDESKFVTGTSLTIDAGATI